MASIKCFICADAVSLSNCQLPEEMTKGHAVSPCLHGVRHHILIFPQGENKIDDEITPDQNLLHQGSIFIDPIATPGQVA